MTPNFLTSIFSAALITGCLSAPSGLVAPLVAHPSSHSVVAVAAAPVVAAAVSEQHHAQDELGQYSYGYSNPLSAKEEVKTVDGITRGGYSYLDSHGLVQSVNYVSDDVNGFRVAASNLPLGPVLPAQDEPVVAHAKAQAVAALAEAAVKDAAEDAANAAAVAKAAAEPLKPIVVAPVPVDAVAVETSPAADAPEVSAAPVVTATPVVSVASPVSAAAPEAEFVAVTPVPPTPVVTKTYPVYSHSPAAVPVAPLGPVVAPFHVAPKAVSVVTAGVEAAVTPAPVVASPVPVSAAPVPVSFSPAVTYSAVPPVAVTPTPAVVPHPVGHVVAITPAPAFVSAAPVVKAAPVAVAAPAPALVSKTVVAASPAPVAVVAAAPVVAGTVTTQHHAQDELGQYSYGYSNPLSAKEEVKTVDGITRGGYSYLDSHGAVQSVNYVSDHVNGFRVAATNLPVQPVHVSLPDSPDVASAKVKFFAEIAKAKEEVEAANRADALLTQAHAEPLPHADVHAQPLPYAVAHAQPLPYAVAHAQPLPHVHPHAHAHVHYAH